MKRVWCGGSCWRTIWLSWSDVSNLSLTVCLMKALQAHIHEWCLTRQQIVLHCIHTLRHESLSALAGNDINPNCPPHTLWFNFWVFGSVYECKCKIEWSHFSVITSIWYMHFWSPMIERGKQFLLPSRTCIQIGLIVCFANTQYHTEELENKCFANTWSSSLLLESRQETCWPIDFRGWEAGKWDKERTRE